MVDHALYVPLAAETELPLALVGGKTAGLQRLIRADLPVPGGFCLTTKAFKLFMKHLAFEGLENLNDEARAMLTAAALHECILAAELPPTLISAIEEATRDTLRSDPRNPSANAEPIPLAVRSSATAEDLPGLSFAGQQATYLNVIGATALLDAIRGCWASLYAERAMHYRQQAGLDHNAVAMAVVVQRMIPAEVAGVMFTANPVSGTRGEILINANYGLGESVVSGSVTPDTFILDRATLDTTSVSLGSKAVRTTAVDTGGTVDAATSDDAAQQAVLSQPMLVRLAELGIIAEDAAGGEPQDLEWAVAEGECYLVQSRPITGLPPEPEAVDWQPPPGVQRLFRRQVVENMSEPLSPLFEELYLGDGLDRGMDQLMEALGLPMNLNALIHRPMFLTVNGFGYLRYDIRMGWGMVALIPKILYFYVTGLPELIRTLTQRWEENGLSTYQALIRKWQAIDADQADSHELIRGIRELAIGDAAYWGYITMMVGAAKVSEGLLAWLLNSRLIPGALTSGAFMRGYPSRTLDAQRSLAELADSLSPALRSRFIEAPPTQFPDLIADDAEGQAFRTALAGHIAEYGHQVFDLDFITPTLSEQPDILFSSLKSLITRDRSKDVDTCAVALERDALTDETANRLGPLRRRLFLKILGWAQSYAPNREAALFYMGAAWPTLRVLALELGRRLQTVGVLDQVDDVFFLTSAELSEVSDPTCSEAQRLTLRRQTQARRELRQWRQRLHPPARVPVDVRFKIGPFDVTRFFEPWETQRYNANQASTLIGFAVSPGKVTAPACIVRSPADFRKMRPGQVLVCPTTTPAWTPLFADAAGLVTDIGAVLAHGSIVAREYGIPAVMGTGNGTVQIADGDLITVDGDKGVVHRR